MPKVYQEFERITRESASELTDGISPERTEKNEDIIVKACISRLLDCVQL